MDHLREKPSYRRTLTKMHKVIEDELFRVESGEFGGDPACELLDIELAYAVDWAYQVGHAVGLNKRGKKR